MSRGVWLNLLVAVLASASLIAVWLTRGVAPSNQSEEQGQSLLPQFRSEDTTRLVLSERGRKIVLQRAASDGGTGAFSLLEPVKELADAATVDKFLSALAHARALRPVEQGQALSRFGLVQPVLRVEALTAQHAYQLALGDRAPTPEGARYLQASTDGERPRLVVIGKDLVEDLTLGLDSFRLRTLVSVNDGDVMRLAITSPKLELRLVRGPGANFFVDGPPKLLADRDTVKSLFFQMSRLSASTFLPLAEAEAAMGAAPAHFELETRASKTVIRFELGGACPGNPSELVVIRRSPEIASACAGRELEATLRLTREDFANRHAFSLHADEVEELDIDFGASKFSLLRQGAGFLLRANGERQVELEAGNQRILRLLEASAERLQRSPSSELGLEPPLGTVTLRSSAAREAEVVREVVRIGKRDATGDLYGYREQDSAVLRIPREYAAAFAVDSTLLYSRKLTEFGPSSFVFAEIQGPEGTQRLRRGPNQELVLEAPSGFAADNLLSSDLIQALGALTAERFVSDRDDGSFGLARSSLALRFAFKNAAGAQIERTLRFGNETPLGVFATLDDGPVFVLPRSVRDTCEVSLISRSLVPSSADTLSSAAISGRGRTLRLERQGERFLVVPRDALPENRVPDVLEAVADLRPEAALHTGKPRAAEGFASPSLIVRLTPKSGAAQTLTFGAGDSWRSSSVFYLRVSGVDATFVIAQSKVRALSEAL